MEKKNTGVIVLVIVLSLMVVGLGGFIVYDKVLSNDKIEDTNVSDNVNTNDNINDNNESDEPENNQTNQEVNNNSNLQENSSDECINEDSVQVDYSKLTDMGTGIDIKSLSGFNYQLSISSKGELSYLNKENGKEGKINVKNVVDVVFQQYFGEENGEYFILTNDGQLYTITEKNMNSNNFEPIKDVVLGKVLKIGTFSTCKPGAGCGLGVYCITADGNTKQLVFRSV